jgi:hypothetical protein
MHNLHLLSTSQLVSSDMETCIIPATDSTESRSTNVLAHDEAWPHTNGRPRQAFRRPGPRISWSKRGMVLLVNEKPAQRLARHMEDHQRTKHYTA